MVDGDRPLGTFSFDALVRALENGSEGADGTADLGQPLQAAGAGSAREAEPHASSSTG